MTDLKKRPSIAARLVILAAAFVFLAFASPLHAQIQFPPGEIYFSPEHRLEDKFTGFISRAQGSIFFCASELDSVKVADALIEARTRRMLPVKILVNKAGAANNPLIDKFLTYQIEVVLAENPSGFDFNFCMTDYRDVYYSSAPFTYRAMNQDYNYAMIISNNEKFAKNFQFEFVEMFEGHYFGSLSPKNTQYPTISWNGATIDTAYLPEDSADTRITSVISRAKTKLRYMGPGLGNSLVTDEILGKRSSVADTTVLFEYGSDNSSKSEYETFRRAGIYAVQNKTFPKVGANVIVADGQYVALIGPSKARDNASLADAFVIVINSREVASSFTNFIDGIIAKNTTGIVLTGQVVNNSNGLPLEGARINFLERNSETYSDYLGWYEFKGELTDEFLVAAEREYYFSKELIFSKKSGTRLDFLLRPIISYNSLSGFVIDAFSRNPVTGCGMTAVYIEKSTGTRTFVRTITNDRGFFTFKALPLGAVDIEVYHPNYQKRVEKAFSIVAGNPISIQDALAITPNYLITAYPNPVFEDNILVNIRDSNFGGEVPRVTIKQHNYAEMPVSMRIAASADLNHVYVGNYVMKRGFYGPARINVNGGMSWKDVNIDFLEAYKKYTYEAPAGSELSGVSLNVGERAVERSGHISVSRDLAPAPRSSSSSQLAPVEGCGPVNIGFGRNLSFAGGASGTISLAIPRSACDPSRGGAPAIYHFDDFNEKWVWKKTSARDASATGETLLEAAFDRAGKYCVMRDSVPPEVSFEKISGASVLVKVSDAGSGVDEASLAVEDAGDGQAGDISVSAGRIEKNSSAVSFTVSSVRDMARMSARLAFRDRNGNRSAVALSEAIRQAVPAAGQARSVTVYPNPCRRFARFRVSAPAGETVTISLYDSAGDRLADICEDRAVGGQATEIIFNTGDLGSGSRHGYGGLSNATYIYRAVFSSGNTINGKISILN